MNYFLSRTGVYFLTFGRFFSLIGLPVCLVCVASRSLFSLSLHAFYEKKSCRMEVPAFMMGSQEQHDMRFREACFGVRTNLFSVSEKSDEALGLNLFSVWVKCAASLS